MSKLIVVIGATGGQGGSVVSSFLDDPQFKVRGVTRNKNSTRAKELEARGVEMVVADVNDEASLEKAFQGAHVIFAVTDYYANFFTLGHEASMEIETKQGINIATAAAKIPTLERYIWSTLPHSSAISQGNAVVPHFEGKARVDVFIKQNKDLLSKTTFVVFTIFAKNLISYEIFKPVYLETARKYIQFYPTNPLATYPSLGDHCVNSGIFVHSIYTNPPAGGTYVKCNVEDLTLESFLEIWGRASGKSPERGSTMVVQISEEQYCKLWPGMGEEQSSQWKLFKYMMENGIKFEDNGETLIDAQDLMTEDAKNMLIGTEESLSRMDWSNF